MSIRMDLNMVSIRMQRNPAVLSVPGRRPGWGALETRGAELWSPDQSVPSPGPGGRFWWLDHHGRAGTAPAWRGPGTHVCVSRSVVSDSLRYHELPPARLLSPWDSPGKNTLECVAISSPGDLPDPGIEPGSPAFQAGPLPSDHQPGTHLELRQLSLPSSQKPDERGRPCSHFSDGETESQVTRGAVEGGGWECRLHPLPRRPSGGTWPSWMLLSRTWERPVGAGLAWPSSAPPIPTPSISLAA